MRKLLSAKEKANYIKEKVMRFNGTWGTEIEILVATALFRCNIFVFNHQKNCWLHFNINSDSKNKWKKKQLEKNIFLILKNQHFMIVKNIKPIEVSPDNGKKSQSIKKLEDVKGGAEE